jgi:RAB6A-GEF complex partner protein 2
MLEAQESLPSLISPPSAARQMHRVHAEHHSSFVHSSLRTTFALDIPSDASPAFQVKIGDATHVPAPTGGLEWKVRLCLLVAVAAESSDPGSQGVRMKHLLRDGHRGEWGSSWKASPSIAPMEHPSQEQEQQATQTQTWGQFFSASFLGESEPKDDTDDGEDGTVTGEGMWDGDGEEQRDFGGGEEGWKDIKVETVECEVPIKVWPGNTAFKATDVVFDV